MSKVPTVDIDVRANVPPVIPPQNSGRFAEIELRILDADAKAKENINREADQRYWLRWCAVGLSFAVVCCMGLMLHHVGYYMLSKPIRDVPAAFLVAVYVAPITSITGISLALLVAAFRAFKDGDEKTGASFVAEGAKATGLIN